MYKNNRKILLIIILLISITLSACQYDIDRKPDKENNKEYPIVTEIENYTYQKMEKQIEKLNNQYSEIKVKSIAITPGKRKLYLIKLGNGDKKIAVVAGVHGRESITSLLTMKLLEEYTAKQTVGKYNLEKILNKVTFYFIPMLNPDGVEIAIKGFSSGPKSEDFYLKANEGSHNYRRWKANGLGVDLNNQFNADWDQVESKNKPHYEKYKGSAPESEIESKALADLTRQENFDLVIAFHHSGSVIYWYYNQNKESYQRDLKLAKKISKLNKYKVIMPEESDPLSAGYKDWFIKEFQKPGFTIEIGIGKSEKPLSSTQLDKYYQENKYILLELATSL